MSVAEKFAAPAPWERRHLCLLGFVRRFFPCHVSLPQTSRQGCLRSQERLDYGLGISGEALWRSSSRSRSISDNLLWMRWKSGAWALIPSSIRKAAASARDLKIPAETKVSMASDEDSLSRKSTVVSRTLSARST